MQLYNVINTTFGLQPSRLTFVDGGPMGEIAHIMHTKYTMSMDTPTKKITHS